MRGWCVSWRSARLPPAILYQVPMRWIGLAVILSLFLAPLVAGAQPGARVARIGYLSVAPAGGDKMWVAACHG